MKEMTLKQIAYVQKMLSDRARMEIVDYIIRNKNVNTAQLLAFSHLSPGTLSFHIKKLKSCDLIIQKGKNKSIVYSINKKVLDDVFNYMDKTIHKAVENLLSWQDFTILETSDYVKIMDLHSDPIRLRIWEIIAQNPYITGKELYAITGQSDANVSFHVQKMIKAQIVCCKKINNQQHYWINVGHALAFHKTLEKNKRKYFQFDKHLSKK